MSHLKLQLQLQLKDLGSKLYPSPSTKDALIKLLKQGATCLSEVEQSPPKSVLEAMQPFLNAVVKPELLKHQDREVNLLVATCICEITRITAPKAPYPDDILKDIFQLIVSTFNGLSDLNSPFFGRRVVILETLAKYRPFVVMLDLDCDHLVKEIFTTFLTIARDEHPENVLTSMETILAVLLEESGEESEDLGEDLVLILLSSLGRNRKDVTPAARRLSMNIIGRCHTILEPILKQFLISSVSGESKSLKLQIDHYEVIYDIYRCAPQILSGVVPYLIGELLTDQLNRRLKAVKLVGDLFALPGSSTLETFQPLYLEYLKRLTDKVVEVRMTVLENINTCLVSDPHRPEAPQIIATLCDRLLDYDENVRRKVVAVICDMASHALSSVPVQSIRLVAERLRDKSLMVKKYTMERLHEIYKNYCLNCSSGSMTIDDYDWIPAKILRCFYDKDFRADIVEPTLCLSLFPTGFSAKAMVKNWVKSFSGFDKVEIKALEKILEQKQRLRHEMQKYLSLRQMSKNGDAAEIQKKVSSCFRLMSRCFVDSSKAEENFQILDQLKDSNIWKIVSTLLDPNTTIEHASTARDDLLRILGEKHRLYEFLSVLSVKCSNLLFNKEHIKEILLEADLQKSTGNSQLIVSCMSILVHLARFCPLLLSGNVEDLIRFLEDDNEIMKEGVLHVLAKAGGAIQEQLRVSSRSLDLMLERICLEGSRRQAKYAVHALASITQDDGLLSLSVIYKRLVDMLQEKSHLPAVLQSLGCIAQTAMSVFETRESEIEGFIRKNILECSYVSKTKGKYSWDDRSEQCSLKIFGIKTLVKSYLPVKDAHLRLGIDELIGTLKNFLSFGEFSTHIHSSSVDKAHMKLAAAKAVLRLARHWDHKIPVDVFYMTMGISEDGFPQVRSHFLSKVHQYIKDRLLEPKYCCAFFLHRGSQKQLLEEDKHNVYDIIQMCQQGKTRQYSGQNDPNSTSLYPEYILSYLVHALAHQSSFPDLSECKDIKSFEAIYRQLYLFLSMLMRGNDDDTTESIGCKDNEKLSAIVSILQSIKHYEDNVDLTKSKNLYVVCDLGLSIIKRLALKEDLLDLGGSVSLPPSLYKPHEKKEGAETLVGESPAWLVDQSVLVYFQSLKWEENETVTQEGLDDDLMGSDTDVSEMPLAKIMKRLKAKAAKARREVKNELGKSGEKIENNVDVLKMVREINSDNLGCSTKYESSNGHGDVSKTKMDHKLQKGKRKIDEPSNISVPKRQRSLSAPSPKSPHAKGTARKGLSSSEPNESGDKFDSSLDERSLHERANEPAESDLLISSIPRNSGLTPKHEENSSSEHDKESKATKIDKHGHKKHYNSTAFDSSPATNNSGSTANKRHRSTAGLAKCTTKGHDSPSINLIGSRIKVWWPKDKMFYKGVVKSYDTQKEKHVVLYDDGDVEVLRLDRERWEIINEGIKPAKPSRLMKVSRSKTELKVDQRRNSSANSPPDKLLIDLSSSSQARRKRTPRKNSMLKKISKYDASLDGGGSHDVSILEPLKPVDHDVDSEENQTSGAEQAENDEGSVSEGKKDSSENFNSDSEEFQDEEHHSEGELGKETIGSSRDAHRSEEDASSSDEEMQQDVTREESGDEAMRVEKSTSVANGTDEVDMEHTEHNDVSGSHSPTNSAELSDDEPLSMWKQRVGK